MIQNWINSKIEEQNKIKAEDIYNNLSQLNDVDFSKTNKDDIIKKIIELNFNEEEIKKAYIKKPVPVPGPVPVPEPVPEPEPYPKEVIELFNEVEEMYGLTSILDEIVVKDKILELKCDKEQVEEWVSDVVSNGGL